jgi:transcription elongation GreA/GreB family factor
MEQTRLSAQARRSLEERLRELDEERIPRLEHELAESGDPVVEAALRATRDEAGRVREALARATPLEDEPHDPTIVELGDTVTVREHGSNELERFTIVGELEARSDSSWISVKSPLGSALLDGRLGQTVDVKTPSGPRRYEVLGIER